MLRRAKSASCWVREPERERETKRNDIWKSKMGEQGRLTETENRERSRGHSVGTVENSGGGEVGGKGERG